jgi:hypothetical protein
VLPWAVSQGSPPGGIVGAPAGLHSLLCQGPPQELNFGVQARVHHCFGVVYIVQKNVGDPPLGEKVLVGDERLVAQTANRLISAEPILPV